MEYGGKKRQVALSIPPECIREEKSMREKKKTVVTLLLCFALLFGAVGAFVATRPAVAEEKTANVIAVNKINTAAGIQIKLTFDQPGHNGNPTILPLRAYLKDVLGGLSEEAQGGIYFSGDEAGELKNLEINIPAAEVEKLPRVIVLGGEGMDINRGADGSSTCKLAEEFRTVFYANEIRAENTIASVSTIGRTGTDLYVKVTFAQGTYAQANLDDALQYAFVNGMKLADVEGVQKWYDEESGAVTPTIGFYVPESTGPFRNDGKDIFTLKAGFVAGDGRALYETKSYRFDANGGIEVLGAEILKGEDLGLQADERRLIKLTFSEYGNNHAALLGELKAAMTFNGATIASKGYDCWFDATQTVEGQQIGKTFTLYIPETDFKNDGTDVLAVSPPVSLNAANAAAPDLLRDTYLAFPFSMNFESKEPVDPEVPAEMKVLRAYPQVIGGNFSMIFEFDNETLFTDAGFAEYRANTLVEGTAKDGTPYSAAPDGSYFINHKYEIPFSVAETGDKTLDLSKPVTVTLRAGITAHSATGTYELKTEEKRTFTQLAVESTSCKAEGENVVVNVAFNVPGADSKFGGYVDDYKSKVLLIGEKKTGENTWEDVAYNLSDAIAGGINNDATFRAGAFVQSWYEGDGAYAIYLKNILPKSTLDLTRSFKIKFVSGFYMTDNKETTASANIPAAVLAYDGDEFAFDGISFEELGIKSYTKELVRGAGDSTVIEIEFDRPGFECDAGAVIPQYRGKIILNGKSIDDPYWKGKVLAWYDPGTKKYQVHIYNDIPEDVFDFHAPITLQIKAGFFIVNPEVTNADGLHVQAQYVLYEDSPVYRVKALPQPVEIVEYYEELAVQRISPVSETADNQILYVTFDRAVSYNTLPHINCPLDWLASVSYLADIPALPYTKAELDYIAANGLNEAVKNLILINGEPLGKRNDADTGFFPNSIYVTYGQMSADVLSINFNKKGINKLDLTKSNEITFKTGFKTPLGGRLDEDVTFRSDPATGRWSVVTE